MMNAFERFNNPTQWVVESMRSAWFKKVDDNTIKYEPIRSSLIVTINFNPRDCILEDISFSGDGKIRNLELENILECCRKFQAERKYSPLKRAILNTPKQSNIWLSEYDESAGSVEIGIVRHNIFYTVFQTGQVTRKKETFGNEIPDYLRIYVWNLATHIVDGY